MLCALTLPTHPVDLIIILAFVVVVLWTVVAIADQSKRVQQMEEQTRRRYADVIAGQEIQVSEFEVALVLQKIEKSLSKEEL